MSDPTQDTQGRDALTTTQQVRLATGYARAAFWMSGIALGITAMAAGPALLGGLRVSTLDRVMIGLWALQAILALSDFVFLPRSSLTRPQIVAAIASSAGAVCAMIMQLASGWLAGVAAAAAFALMTTGLIAIKQHHRNVMASLRAPSST